VYKTVLVDTDIDDGRRLLENLEKAIRVTAAFWSHSEDDDEWQLVIVSPDVAERGPTQVYKMLLVLLNNLNAEAGRTIVPLDRVMIISPSSLVYKTMKQRSGPVGGPVREGPALDAYIYKMN
jgi:hypothetical protein